MQTSRYIILIPLLSVLLGACASERTVTKKQVKQDMWGRDERYSMGKDKDGNPVMKSDLRSSLEGKRSSLVAHRDFSGKDYNKKSYRKKRWGGNTLFNRKKYQGNTDASQYKSEPWFVRKQALASGERSFAQNKRFSLLKPFKKTSASENASTRIPHTSDAETDFRKRVFKQPEITNWKNQTGMSVEDTNRMLGR